MEKKTKAKLLIVGNADKGDSCLEDALLYSESSPFADKERVMGVSMQTDNRDLMYNYFYQYNRTHGISSILETNY